MKKITITSIYPSGDIASVNAINGEYRQSFTVSIAKMTAEQQAAWLGALQFLGASVLRDGEIVQDIVLEIRRDGVFEAMDDGDEICRDEVRAAVTVEMQGVGSRTVQVSSEILPLELRDGLIAIWSGLEAGGVELLDSLKPAAE